MPRPTIKGVPAPFPEHVDQETHGLLHPDGSPVIDVSTGEEVIWDWGDPSNPAFYDWAQPPVMDTTFRFDADGLVFFVRKPDITEAEARIAFNAYTGGQYPEATATPYEVTLWQLSKDWNAGLGTVIYPD